MDSADLGPAMSLHYAGQNAKHSDTSNGTKTYLVRIEDGSAALLSDCFDAILLGDGGLLLVGDDGNCLAAFAPGHWKSICQQRTLELK